MFGARLVPGSGSGMHYKDDGTTGSDLDSAVPVRFEAKGTNTGSYVLDPSLYVNLRDRAVSRDQLPFVAIRFHRGTPTQSDWALVEDQYLSKAELGALPAPSRITEVTGRVTLRASVLEANEHAGGTPCVRWSLRRKVRMGRTTQHIDETLCLVVMRLRALARITNGRHLSLRTH